MALSAVPSLKLSAKGLFDGGNFTFTSVFVDCRRDKTCKEEHSSSHTNTNFRIQKCRGAASLFISEDQCRLVFLTSFLGKRSQITPCSSALMLAPCSASTKSSRPLNKWLLITVSWFQLNRNLMKRTPETDDSSCGTAFKSPNFNCLVRLALGSCTQIEV